MKTDGWKVDKTTKEFISIILDENDEKISEFRQRWKLGKRGLKDGSYFNAWKEKVEEECQNLRREINILELEAYLDMANFPLVQPILSLNLEDKFREQHLGKTLQEVFGIEIRHLGYTLNLPQEFDLFLENYITYNDKNYDLIFNHGMGLSIRYQFNEEFGLLDEKVCLTLGNNTASPDLDNYWVKEIKPLLINLQSRIRDKKRLGKNYAQLKRIVAHGKHNNKTADLIIDPATGKKERLSDAEIAIEGLSEKEADIASSYSTPEEEKQKRKSSQRKVQNQRHYYKKQHILH